MKVVYLIALKDFKNIDPEMFTCTVNMPDDGAPNGKRLNVEVSDHPSSIKYSTLCHPMLNISFKIMLRVGLTGGIGSGKTLVAEVFKSLSVPVFNADVEGKKATICPTCKRAITNSLRRSYL